MSLSEEDRSPFGAVYEDQMASLKDVRIGALGLHPWLHLFSRSRLRLSLRSTPVQLSLPVKEEGIAGEHYPVVFGPYAVLALNCDIADITVEHVHLYHADNITYLLAPR